MSSPNHHPHPYTAPLRASAGLAGLALLGTAVAANHAPAQPDVAISVPAASPETPVASVDQTPPVEAAAADANPISIHLSAAQLAVSAETAAQDTLATETTKPPKKHHPKHHKPHKKPEHHPVHKPRPLPRPVHKPPTKPVEPVTKQPPLPNLHPEQLSVPSDVSEIMHEDVVYLPALGCSGFLIRDAAGEAIGVETAQHCSMLQKYWLTDSDGNPGVYLNDPGVVAETGDEFGQLSQVGTITKFILNTNMQHDQAIGVFGGQSPQAVLDAYNAQHLSPEAVAQLKKGDVIYNSGWPVNQLNNSGPLERQQFAMRVLGTTTWGITNGEQLNLLVAAVPESKDGAECSWGNSGSEGFVMINQLQPDGTTKEVPMSVGTASAFNDFGLLYNQSNPQAAADEKQYIEQEFDASMDGFVGVCGFAFETPSPETGMTVVNVLNTFPEKGGDDYVADMEAQFDTNFFNSAYTRNIIHGLVEIDNGKAPYYVRDPAYVYDGASQTLILGFWSGEQGGDDLGFVTYEGPTDVQNLTIYSPDGTTLPNITTTSMGTVTVGDNEFIDSNGQVIGQQVDTPPTNLTDQSALSLENGQLTLSPAVGK